MLTQLFSPQKVDVFFLFLLLISELINLFVNEKGMYNILDIKTVQQVVGVCI